MKKISVEGTIFSKIFGEPMYVEDMPSTDTTLTMAQMRENAILVGNKFSFYIDLIRRTPFLGERICNLGKLIWGLVGNRIIPAAISDTPMNTIAFCGEGRRQDGGITDGKFAAFIIPPTWLELVAKDPFMQCGAVIFTSSQARDYYNGHMHLSDTITRAYAFEAEALHRMQNAEESWTPNKYQKAVMQKYPQGIDSLPPGLWYESKPYIDPRPGENI